MINLVNRISQVLKKSPPPGLGPAVQPDAPSPAETFSRGESFATPKIGGPPSAKSPLIGSVVNHIILCDNLAASGIGSLAVAISRSAASLQKIGILKGAKPVRDPLPANQLIDLPSVSLSRPVLLVPGFNTSHDRFDHMIEKLTENGLNGGRVHYVSHGKTYADKQCQQPLRPNQEAKVFVVVFDSANESPPAAADNLHRSLARLRKLSGQKVDVAAYSMGGLATRLYLDRGGKDVGKFMMVGTPNHGSPWASISTAALMLKSSGKDVDWLLSNGPKKISMTDRSALSWLEAPRQGTDNPALKNLNATWAAQIAEVESYRIVGSAQEKTMGLDFRTTLGDKAVPVESLAVDDSTPVTLLDNQSLGKHGYLFSNPHLYGEMTDFFGWQTQKSSV